MTTYSIGLRKIIEIIDHIIAEGKVKPSIDIIHSFVGNLLGFLDICSLVLAIISPFAVRPLKTIKLKLKMLRTRKLF